jgi:hypothetical protein
MEPWPNDRKALTITDPSSAAADDRQSNDFPDEYLHPRALWLRRVASDASMFAVDCG